jgi:hypothetical protein
VAITAPSPAAVIRPKINIAREIVNRSVIAMLSGRGKTQTSRK